MSSETICERTNLAPACKWKSSRGASVTRPSMNYERALCTCSASCSSAFCENVIHRTRPHFLTTCDLNLLPAGSKKAANANWFLVAAGSRLFAVWPAINNSSRSFRWIICGASARRQLGRGMHSSLKWAKASRGLTCVVEFNLYWRGIYC